MRCTQYIGLTKAADDFIKEMEMPELLTKDHVIATGMFGEDVHLRAWTCSDKLKELRDYWEEFDFYEVEQCSPWSSGPMIFTCLEARRRSDGFSIRFFEWHKDPRVSEVNYESGGYYV